MLITTNYDLLIKSIRRKPQEDTLSSYPALELETLGQLYSFKNQAEVMRFLENNPFLIKFLYEAYQQIQIYFGKSAQVILEVMRHQELGVFVRTGLPVDEALDKLE
jgi:hypothetical protein